jgi:hypothetical protein
MGRNCGAKRSCCAVGSTRPRPLMASVYPPSPRFVTETLEVCIASGKPFTPCDTERMDERIDASGRRMPIWWQKDEDHAPPASIATFVRITPRSVTTALTRPPSVSNPRAAQIWCTVLPRLRMARATAGAAFAGSAMPSVGEKTPPFQARPVAAPREVASVALRRRVLTPTPRAKSHQRPQPSSSVSSLLR